MEAKGAQPGPGHGSTHHLPSEHRACPRWRPPAPPRSSLLPATPRRASAARHSRRANERRHYRWQPLAGRGRRRRARNDLTGPADVCRGPASASAASAASTTRMPRKRTPRAASSSRIRGPRSPSAASAAVSSASGPPPAKICRRARRRWPSGLVRGPGHGRAGRARHRPSRLSASSTTPIRAVGA